jgi:OmpA-OmpF porin, OOP family
MTSIQRCSASLLFGALAALTAGAQPRDVRNSQDHPLISRYPGSIINQYSVTEFDELDLPLGKLQAGKASKSQHLEGKITRIVYNGPGGRSLLEVYRNYESALQKGNLSTVWSCINEACGVGGITINSRFRDDWSWGSGHRALTAKAARPQGDIWVSLHIGQWANPTQGTTLVLYIVELKPMEADLIKVDAVAMGGDLERTGHTAIYGIYFDTNKAEVKPESDAAIQEIAKLLSQTPTLKLYVVGHTDSTGVLAANMDLSKRRAEAVVQTLVAKHKVAAARLTAMGCGPLAPVAPNDAEEGRAKNRRVELVKQ